VTEDSIITSVQPTAESDDEDLSDAAEFSEDELEEVRDSIRTSFQARPGQDNEQLPDIEDISESESEEELGSEETESEESFQVRMRS
jgi:hypothetical protein